MVCFRYVFVNTLHIDGGGDDDDDDYDDNNNNNNNNNNNTIAGLTFRRLMSTIFDVPHR